MIMMDSTNFLFRSISLQKLLLLFLPLLFCFAAAQQQAIVPNDYATLQAALTAGETNIFIRDGLYLVPSTIQISTPNILIRGESRENTILQKTGIASFLLLTNTENVTVESLTLDAKTYDSSDNQIWEAFGVVNCNSTTLRDAKILGSMNMFAVFFAGPSNQYGGNQETIDAYDRDHLDYNNIMEDCYVESYFPGDVLSFSLQKNGRLTGNTVVGGVVSFFMNKDSYCNKNRVENSTTAGIFVSVPAENNYVQDNVVVASRAAGIKVARQIDHVDPGTGQSLTPLTYRASGILLTGNTIVDGRYFGMEIDQTVGALIAGNEISLVDYSGIYLLHTDQALVMNNRIVDFGQSYHRTPVWNWDAVQNSGIFGDYGTTTSNLTDNFVVNRTSGGTNFGIKIAPWGVNTGSNVYDNKIHGSFLYNGIDVPLANNNAAENNHVTSNLAQCGDNQQFRYYNVFKNQ
mmetsp:Transcript_25438/g.37582  ORF Transcript_25438/g.37582 Transcript_25438/m.37582 type:complete len:460 (+) Transcript_25438:179-1558(+)